MTNFRQGDTVMVEARPKPYKARVEWVDRSFSGDPVKAKVRPFFYEGRGWRARNVMAKNIIEIVTSTPEPSQQR